MDATESQMSSMAAQCTPESLPVTHAQWNHRFRMMITEKTPTMTVSNDPNTYSSTEDAPRLEP